MTEPLPKPYNSPYHWAKVDMFCTVSLDRLTYPWDGRKHDGSRNYIRRKISEEDFLLIQKCMLHAIGMSGLIEHLDQNE